MKRVVPPCLSRRRAALGGLAALALGPAFGQAPAWPARPVRLVVPYAAGGPTDAVARVLSSRLAPMWGQGVVVENKPGANANLGAGEVARAAPDGYTLLVGTGSTHGINPAIYPKLPFDPVKDFVPVVQLTDSVLYIAVQPALPVKDLRELVAYSKANPGKVNYASVGIGSPHHLAGEMLKLRTGADITHVPYKGSGPARQGLLAGEVQLLFDSAVLPLAQAGQVRVLAVTSARRWPASPQVPTAIEQGLPDFVVSGWYALFAPAGTPAAVVQKVNADVNKVLAEPEVQERVKALSVVIQGGSAKDLENLVAQELARWPAVVKASGAKFE
ncbi:MAG TPA: tripartite tricarboxylate transporter substrate binding protein [Ramlibacter sp.]|nr:tripartite tricarboxylate transporter substrate binding protein [Ramlibacter sp.]